MDSARFISSAMDFARGEIEAKTGNRLLSALTEGLNIIIGIFDPKTGELLRSIIPSGRENINNEGLLRTIYRKVEEQIGLENAAELQKPGEMYSTDISISSDEETRWFRAYRTVMEWAEDTDACIIYAADITQKEKEKYVDRLLDIPNMMQFEIDINKLFENPENYGAVLLLDLDDFKNINDAYGHDLGDHLLKKIKAFLDTFRAEGVEYYRFAGDEFIILMKEADRKEAENLTRLILSGFRTPWYVEDEELFITASIGVAFFPEHGATLNDITRSMDVAMHQAKLDGKDNAFFFISHLRERFVSSVTMERKLRRAIANDFEDFRIYYQPIMNLKTGECEGAEALIRWVDPQQGMIVPGHFIPLAEKTGLIVPLGEWTLQMACNQAVKWNRIGKKNFYVSVNLSKRQARLPSSIARIKKIVSETGVKPGSLMLEVTESLEIQDLETHVGFLNDIRSAGVRVAMDDFGTGYSSLGNLRNIPLDCIKIDRSFIQGVDSDSYSLTFIRSIVNLAHGLGMSVCVEGIETADQLNKSIDLESDYGQGYYYSMPVPVKEFERKFGWNSDET